MSDKADIVKAPIALAESAFSAAVGGWATLRAVAIAGIVAFVFGFALGWQVQGWHVAKVELKEERAGVAATAAENARRRAIATQHAQKQHDIEVFYDGLPDWWRTMVAERPDLDRVELGPRGLCLWNAWNKGPAAGARPCADDQGAGGAAAGDVGPLPGLGGEPPPVHEELPRVRGPAQQPH